MVNPSVTVPIIGVSKLEQLEENMGVLNHTLSPDALKRIGEVSKPDWLREG
jgi:aryl-alcohol dehydrogenase-like predicted oxidoreductase